MSNFVFQIFNLIAGTVRGLFQHDGSTRGASVQFWAVAATVLLLLKFAVDSIGPRFTSRRFMAPGVQLLAVLYYYAVAYTLGLMEPSDDDDGSEAAMVNNFFQVWAVLITTMQDSIRIGRPYKPKEMSLIDLLSSLWSANQLRGPAPTYLKVPLWLMWSIHAARIIWYYISFSRASDANLTDMKLVSDYMMTSQHTDEHACPRTMHGYKYIVFGEDEQKMEVRPPGFTLEMDLDGPNAHKLITLEMIWKQAGESSRDKLLSSTGDPDNRFKDVCLSFALYKLQRRRFYNFPIAEAMHPATRQLVSDNILMYDEATGQQPVSNNGIRQEHDDTNMHRQARTQQPVNNDIREEHRDAATQSPATGQQLVSDNDIPEEQGDAATHSLATRQQPVSHNDILGEHSDNGSSATATGQQPDPKRTVKRAFRITGVELSFLQDLFYSKHAAVFARGFPYVRLLLSVLMTGAALYLIYAVRDLPSFSEGVTGDGRVARITHGVFVTHCIIAVVVFRELWEVGVYVLSQWTNVWIIGRHMKLTRLLNNQLSAGAMEQVKPFQRAWWALQLLMLDLVARIMFFVVRRGRWNRQILQHNALTSDLIEKRKVKVRSEVAGALFRSLKDLIHRIPSPSTGQATNRDPTVSWNKETNKLLKSYFRNAFKADHEPATPFEDPADGLEGETHRILVWHIATSLCQILRSQEAGPHQRGDTDDYVTAVRLSNYCAYLVTEALVPDNGLVARKVFHSVRDEIRQALGGYTKMSEIHDKLAAWPEAGTTILRMGLSLSKTLTEKYPNNEAELWKRLAKFWAGFLLHLSASTRAAKHLTHLQGRGELTTHLWVLLSHAGFLGATSHGEQLLDPTDLQDA